MLLLAMLCRFFLNKNKLFSSAIVIAFGFDVINERLYYVPRLSSTLDSNPFQNQVI